MDHTYPSQHDRDDSPPESLTKRRRRNPEYTRSFLGLPSLLEDEENIRQATSSDAQCYQQMLGGELSNNTRLPNLNYMDANGFDDYLGNIPPQDIHIHTVMISDDGTGQGQRHTLPLSTTPALPVVPMPSFSPGNLPPVTDTKQENDQTQTAISSTSYSPVESKLPESTLTKTDPPKDLTKAESRGEKYDECYQEEDGNRGRQRTDESDPEQRLSPSQGEERILTSPLSHPNGTSMFPHLSTPEQEELAQEALAQAEESIVADSLTGSDARYQETDGGYDSDGFSSGSTSAESSVRDYMYENGRRYHRFREGSYNFPNDDVEQEREDMKHAMVKLLCSQKLHFAPIGNNPQEVLDLGTGTGIWAIESELP